MQSPKTTSLRKIALLSCLAAGMVLTPAAAQTLTGIDPVKVKTIPIAPSPDNRPALANGFTPTVNAPAPPPPKDVPATNVKTLRLDPKGNVLGDADAAKPAK